MVAGNGDISVMWSGGGGAYQLFFGKADFWGVVRGNITTAGNLRLECDELKAATGMCRQNLGQATITTKETGSTGELSTCTWVAYPENLIVTEMTNTGTSPLHFHTALQDGAGHYHNAADRGATADSTWLSVSPDLVEFQVGDREVDRKIGKDSKKVHEHFVGSIAGLDITSPEYPKPFLSLVPSDPEIRNIGNLKITPGDAHGDSVTFDNEADHRLILPEGCLPQTGFTFTAWVNPSVLTEDGTIFQGIAREKFDGYPYFRGFLVHLLNGRPEVRLNYYQATAPEPIALNQWTEIQAVYDKQVLKVLVNGKEVARGENPPASAQMGWDKCTLRTGDPDLPFKGCAPKAILRQHVVGAASQAAGTTLAFTVDPGKTVDLLVSLVSDRNSPDYIQVAERLANSSPEEIAKLKTAHDTWWHTFWGRSFVEIPDKAVMENWYGSIYDLAVCSRGDCPPPGLWYNFGRGMNSPWDGDYTLDYNYQAPFWAGLSTNHFELTDNYDPLLLDHISRGRSIAENAWRMNPAGQPRTLEDYIAERNAAPHNPNPTSYKGIYLYTHLIPLPGWSNDYGTFWGQKSNALFCTVNMVQRWRLTRDLAYARKVYPFLKGTAEFWDDYLVLKDGHYKSLKDALCENSGDNTNPATTISFLRLLYPSLVEISQKLNLDADERAKWNEILQKLSPFTYVSVAQCGSLKTLLPPEFKDKMVIRDCEDNGPDFPKPAYGVYQDHKIRGSSAGMSCVQAIFPGWSFGLESTKEERDAALNSVTFAAQWFDFNNSCNFYADAAAAGYDPKEILANMDALLATYQTSDFTIRTPGGGTEDVAIIPCGLHYMFLQSHQANIHIFPNWPKEMDATFGDLPACGGFTVSSKQEGGKILYVVIKSQAGEVCHLANPWPGMKVSAGGTTLSGEVLTFPTKAGDRIVVTPLQ